MEEGSLRCDANVSLRPAGSDELGTKTELKNMNSFRFLERGIEAEIERQAAILDAGGRVEQETLHFDPRTGALTPLRSKEYSHDYRYFPEPDLVPLEPTEEMIARRPRGAARAARRAPRALPGASSGSRDDSRRRELAFDAELGAYFERSRAPPIRDLAPSIVANWVTGELAGRLREAGEEAASRPRPGCRGAGEARRAWSRRSRSRTAPRARCWRPWSRRAATRPTIAEREGLGGIEDSGELEAIVERAIEADPEAAARVRDGNVKAIGPLVGLRDARDQGPRRRRRGDPADPRSSARLSVSLRRTL